MLTMSGYMSDERWALCRVVYVQQVKERLPESQSLSTNTRPCPRWARGADTLTSRFGRVVEEDCGSNLTRSVEPSRLNDLPFLTPLSDTLLS